MSSKDTITTANWRVAVGRVISLVVTVTGFHYIIWRFDTLQGIGFAGIALYLTEVINYCFTVLTAFLYWRVRHRTGPPTPPFGTLDVFIPVCGEPVEIVEQTLQAALAIRFSHETYILNDGRRAGKANWNAIEALASRYGVPCYTRMGGPPRKAGNLNNALQRTCGQFVAVIDADHVVTADFAHEVLGYFSDEKVGLVTTPQRVKTDRFDLLGNNETFFYSYIQPAKDAANSAFSCGSGVVYRRTALESIAGFSEWNIVEDLHTSYRMHAKGWRSVYHPRTLTIGLSPGTGAELVNQRLGWATDSLRLWFWDNPLWKSGLSLMQRLNYLHIGGFYLVMIMQITFFVTPVLHLLWDIPILHSDSVFNYVIHAMPYFSLLLLYVVCVGGFQGGLRAIQKGIFLAPTFLLAAIRAATGINFASPVTEKGRQKGVSLLLLPQYLALAFLLAGIVKGLLEPSDAKAVSVFWATWIASALAIPVLTLGFQGRSSHVIRLATRGFIASAGLFAASIVLFSFHPFGDITAPRESSPTRFHLGWETGHPSKDVRGHPAEGEPQPAATIRRTRPYPCGELSWVAAAACARSTRMVAGTSKSSGYLAFILIHVTLVLHIELDIAR